MVRKRLFSFFVLLSLLIVAACGGSSSGDEDDGEDNDGGTGLEATLSSIQENIFTPTCARSGCHSAASASGGLSLADGDSFGELVGTESSEAPTLERVEAGDPDNSYLVNKLKGTAGDVGGTDTQMPLGESALSDEEIEAIEEWITNGAENN